MKLLIGYLLGFTSAIHPWQWLEITRHLKNSEGWVPPMMIIASFGVLFGINSGLGLLGNNAFVRFANYLAVSTWFAVATFATIAVSIDGLRNIFRFGISPFVRPRYWFEISRLAFNLACLFVVMIFAFAVVALKLPPRVDSFVLNAICVSASVFALAATCGYAASFASGRKQRGRAFECVQYFYGLTMAGSIVAISAFALPNWIPMLNNPLFLPIAIAGTALLAVCIVKIFEKRRCRISTSR